MVDEKVIDDGGQAFPGSPVADKGMTLRDYFAAIALPALLADESFIGGAKVVTALGLPEDTPYVWQIHWPRYMAIQAYQYADAMLAERKAT